MKIITGQSTVNFRRQLQPDKEHQSFSLIYANGERSLDLICKDKVQADSWLIGLRAVISRCHRSRPFPGLRSHGGALSCINSPAGFIRRKRNLGILEDATELSQVRSLCGSPTQSVSDRCFSDGFSLSSDSFCISESSLQQMQNVADTSFPNSPYVEPNINKCGSIYAFSELQKEMSHRFVTPTYGSPQTGKNDILKDVLIWGEGVEGGNIGGMVQKLGNQNGMQVDALVPKLLESTVMLDVQSISLGGKHAALITKRREVFCWGEGSGGKLGHKVNMDFSYPKVVDSLGGVRIKSVACGEYQTCALTDSGELYIWGDNKSGANLVEVRTRNQWLPYKLSGPFDSITISKVACGEWHTAILSSSGQLFTYGDGTFGVLGHGNLQSVSYPKEIESLRGLWVKSVACGSWHTAAIVDIVADRLKFNAVGGKLFTWGDGDKGRLGHIDMGKKLVPTCVAQLVECDFVQVSCGRMLTVSLTNTGRVYTMGTSLYGLLGNPQAKDKSITIVEGKLKDEFVKEISSGSYHVAALTSEGRVYTWGKGTNGQLGLGITEDRNSPTFVGALRNRLVESITCGSNLTAVICLHKSISITDQSACNDCRMPFGLTRKKHNCYNCGLLFCHACSARKVINASLAPNKSKPSRVCDSCFMLLQKATDSGRIVKLENQGPKQKLSSNKMLSDEKEGRGEATPVLLKSQLYDLDSQAGKKITLKKQGEKEQHLETVSSFSAGISRWGQVSCPAVFESYYSKHSAPPVDSRSPVSSVVNTDKVMFEANETLSEEVQRLRAEARSLEMQCEIGTQKIQECQETIEKTWSLAREEAAKRKAANEIIKALALRLHAMSEKLSSGKGAKVRADLTTNSQKAQANTNSPCVSPRPPLALFHLPPEVKLSKDGQRDSLSSSPITFSNTLKSLDARGLFKEIGKSDDDSHTPRTNSRRNGTKGSRLEWVEKCEPGVYITFTTLPCGRTGLKRVRFSRKRFAEKEAERWWEENQVAVYQKYGIEGYVDSNQNQIKSYI
ncbi:hypothetical protein MANES_01G123500v8 [Manihot esculenta]|nr:hypothetical protein MANES_01G123500v8 [Manihot esculenta]OAY60582.1 hypothetical protein MANES_01G123500v8 [Manihot esculenta]